MICLSILSTFRQINQPSELVYKLYMYIPREQFEYPKKTREKCINYAATINWHICIIGPNGLYGLLRGLV